MFVNQILLMKVSGDIYIVVLDVIVVDVVKLLFDKCIGVIVVLDDGKVLLGILLECDIVCELGWCGVVVLDQLISDLMMCKLMICFIGEDVLEILNCMMQGCFCYLLVVDEQGYMLGIVLIGDVVFVWLKELVVEKEVLIGMIMGN